MEEEGAASFHAYVRVRTDRCSPGAQLVQVSGAVHSPSSQHKQAASAHELAARQHRAAAEFHDKGMEHAAQLSSTSAKARCMKAHAQSMLACEHSAEKSPLG